MRDSQEKEINRNNKLVFVLGALDVTFRKDVLILVRIIKLR